MKNQGLSDFTKKYRKERSKLKGGGSKSAKLIQMKVNKTNNYVTFYFLSEPTYTFTTKSTQPNSMKLVKDNLYTQQIRINNLIPQIKELSSFKNNKIIDKQELKNLLINSGLKIWCDCPSQWWQGLSYNLTQQFDGSIYPNNIKPEKWIKKHGSQGLICKHLDLIMTSISFWLNPMASMLNKYLKKYN
jgi:hypothetical protein